MFTHVRARHLWCIALLLVCAPAHAGPVPLDLPTALARARAHAPAAIAALGRVDEARARRAGARVWFTQNPTLEVGAGRRSGTASLALEAQLAQPLELGRRGARVRAADAAIASAQAHGDAALRELAFAVHTAFNEARHAELAVELAERDRELAGRVAEVAARRRTAGDLTDLDVNLATIALGRARSSVAAAQAMRAEALGRLAALIGAAPDDELVLAGDLRPAPLSLGALRAAAGQRADLRALAAEAREAQAEEALAVASGRPDIGVWAGFERDDGDSIFVGGLALTLPVWNRAQGERAAARATRRRAERERAAVHTAAARQVADAFAAYTRARDAVEVFERDVLPVIADSEVLIQRSVDAGQIAIDAYLVARQQVLDGRREHLARRLQLAQAAAAAQFVAGVAP